MSAERNNRLVEAIARVCHQVNKAYCASQGDYSQPDWEQAPEWQKSSARTGVVLHLNNPDAGPKASHDSWLAQKAEEGWSYGAYKDPEAKKHPCFVPFEDLPQSHQAKDFIFRAIVHAIAQEQAS